MTTKPATWRDNLVDVWGKLKLADRGLQIEKDARRQRATEHAIAEAYRQAGIGGTHPLEGEELSVSIGDTYHATPAAPPASISTLGKIGVAAALLTGGAGAYKLAEDWAESDPSPPVAPAVTDTDTQYEFRLLPELSGDR